MNCRNEIYDCDRCDHRYRRVQKIVKQYDGATWETAETHTFVWDGNNIVLEKIAFANGTTRTCEYFWGADKSGSEQGAGGVEGLLAVSVDGVFYIPCYDHNGNIILYVSETGGVVAQYTYDPYGNVVDSFGELTAVFSFGFSTKYHDREMGMVGYQRRFYRPDLGRWLNRDPIEEEGCENLYAFCNNSPVSLFDILGLFKWEIGATKILDDLGDMGTVTNASQQSGSPSKEVGENILATTGVDWSISVTCACNKKKWGADSANGNFTPVIHLRTSYSSLGDKYATSNFRSRMIQGEYDHVKDLLAWANGEGTTEVEEFLSRNRNRQFSNRQVCETSLSKSLSSRLSASISIVILQSQLKWDVPGKHTLNTN